MATAAQGTGGGAELVFRSVDADPYTASRRPLQASKPDLTVCAPLDEATVAALRQAWWRLRRHHGVRLPAERGVIVINGGAP